MVHSVYKLQGAHIEIFSILWNQNVFYTLYYFLSFPPPVILLLLSTSISGKVTKISKKHCLYLLKKDYTEKKCKGISVFLQAHKLRLLIITGALCCHLRNTVIFISQGPYSRASVKCTALEQHTSSGTLDQRASRN